MTSPQQQQRHARHSPPLNPREAALVGALTAFAKAPTLSRSPNNGGASQNYGKQRAGAAPRIPVSRSSTRSPSASVAGSPPRTIRDEPAAVSKAATKDTRGLFSSSLHADTGSSNGAAISGQLHKKTDNATSDGDVAPLASQRSIKSSEEENRIITPSTSSLVKLYESKGTAQATVRPETPLKSPKPVRKSLVLSQDDRTVSSHLAGLTSPTNVKTVATVPHRHVSIKSNVSSLDSFKSAQDIFPVHPLPQSKPAVAEKPSLPPRRPSVQPPTPVIQQSGLSPIPRPTAHSLPNQSAHPYNNQAAASSTASIQATYNSLHPRRMSALRTGDSLANAIVASSLASSRAPSPSKFSPQPPTLRSKHSHHSIFARTPSPNKHKPASAGGLSKHTLRKDKSSSSDDDGVLDDDPYYKHKRKRHLHKHANKYNEGDRKRWRNAVTETERGRYEGLWAANRGLLSTSSRQTAQPSSKAGKSSWRDDERTLLYGGDEAPPDTESTTLNHSEDVHAFVVRDIWNRSRLPAHVLEEIWTLVYNNGGGSGEIGWLCKEEFVVGLWLVDQRLKGRKLPVRVSDSVWDSVRLLAGIKIRSGRKGW